MYSHFTMLFLCFWMKFSLPTLKAKYSPCVLDPIFSKIFKGIFSCNFTSPSLLNQYLYYNFLISIYWLLYPSFFQLPWPYIHMSLFPFAVKLMYKVLYIHSFHFLKYYSILKPFQPNFHPVTQWHSSCQVIKNFHVIESLVISQF